MMKSQTNAGGIQIQIKKTVNESFLAGRAVTLYMREGWKMGFKVTSTSPGIINGYDEEGLNL